MAVTVTAGQNQPFFKTFDVEADADGDTSAVITHGYAMAPQFVWLVPLLAEFYVSTWFVAAITATTITLTKANAVGSGAAGNQVRVITLNQFPFLHF